MSKTEKIINKIDDLRKMCQYLSLKGEDDLMPVMNCLERLLFEIQEDIAELAETL